MSRSRSYQRRRVPLIEREFNRRAILLRQADVDPHLAYEAEGAPERPRVELSEVARAALAPGMPTPAATRLGLAGDPIIATLVIKGRVYRVSPPMIQSCLRLLLQRYTEPTLVAMHMLVPVGSGEVAERGRPRRGRMKHCVPGEAVAWREVALPDCVPDPNSGDDQSD